MNREQRRQIKKKIRDKAEDIWLLETLIKVSTDNDVKSTAMMEVTKIASQCTDEELYLIDMYLTDKYGRAT